VSAVGTFENQETSRLPKLHLLLVESNPTEASAISAAIARTSVEPPEVVHATTVAEAVGELRDGAIDVVLVSFQASNWLRRQVDRRTDPAARRKPVVAWIDPNRIVSLREAIDSRVSGVYYKDQIDESFIRRLTHLALSGSLSPARKERAASSRKRARAVSKRLRSHKPVKWSELVGISPSSPVASALICPQ
jgi:DNA-binding NarL/FixJ family response regulator